MDFFSMPVVMIENIFSYLSYDEVAKNRLVCKAFNDICSRMLNRGFLMIERQHALALKSVKAQLPRRESERRYHPLSRHCDILTSIETRISMLNMTYSKFIDNALCCFIPGKVIDEIKRVLHIVESSQTPPRAHEVLQELRDISSMAIEHFDDKISPAFRKKLQEGVTQPPARQEHGVLSPMAMRQEFVHMRRRFLLSAKLSLFLVAQYKKYYKRMFEYRRMAMRQSRTIKDMCKKQKEQDSTIADLKKRIEECDIKYSELTHTNQAVGGKAISGGGSEVTSGSSRHFSSQIKLDLSMLPIGTSKRNSSKMSPTIKARKPVIKFPSIDDSEPPKKLPKLELNSEPRPSTSRNNSQLRTASPKPQSTLSRIKDFTNEIRQLAQISNREGKLKRTLNLSDTNLDSLLEPKKMKKD